MKLKRFEILSVCETLDKYKGSDKKVFMYYVSKLRKSLDDERNLIIETGRPSERYLKYESLKKEIAEKYCEKDESGNLKYYDKKYKIMDNCQDIVKEELVKLNEEYKEDIEKRKKEFSEFMLFLDQEVECDISKIPLSYIPDQISREDMDNIIKCVDNDVV
jgi:hypothetical protein